MRVKIMIISLLCFFTFSLLTAEEIPVSPGTNVISETLTMVAYPGDILVLEAGTYFETSSVITPNYEVNIRGISGQTIVQTTNGDNHFTLMGNLTLEGIIFEGLSSSDSAGSAVVNNTETPNVLKVDDCEFRNFKGSAIYKEADNQEKIPFDSVTVRNSLFHDCSSGIYLGGDHPSGGGQHPDNVSGAHYLWVENCTFYNMKEIGIKLEAYIPSGEPIFVYIDHVTIDNCGDKGLYLKEINLLSMIWNSIITNCNSGVHIKYGPQNLMVTYSDVWNNTTNYVSASGGSVSAGEGSFSEDPMYTDATSGDYTLLEGSPCIGTAADGQNMGDLRWMETSVDDVEKTFPTVFSLSQNYPNPFNPATTISYSVVKHSLVTLDIYSITGQKVRSLFNKIEGAGSYSVIWNGLDDMGNSLCGGVYFYRLRSGSTIETKKMLLLK